MDHCPSASFVLKSDDDQAVDTFHLKRYLHEYVEEASERRPFFLCDPQVDHEVHR